MPSGVWACCWPKEDQVWLLGAARVVQQAEKRPVGRARLFAHLSHATHAGGEVRVQTTAGTDARITAEVSSNGKACLGVVYKLDRVLNPGGVGMQEVVEEAPRVAATGGP